MCYMVATTDKEPLHCYISYANEHDATAAKKYLPTMKANSDVIGDKGYVSKKVETVFSIITDRFGNVIKATSIDDFLTKLKLFITAYSMDCFLKLSDEQKQLAI